MGDLRSREGEVGMGDQGYLGGSWREGGRRCSLVRCREGVGSIIDRRSSRSGRQRRGRSSSNVPKVDLNSLPPQVPSPPSSWTTSSVPRFLLYASNLRHPHGIPRGRPSPPNFLDFDGQAMASANSSLWNLRTGVWSLGPCRWAVCGSSCWDEWRRGWEEWEEG